MRYTHLLNKLLYIYICIYVYVHDIYRERERAGANSERLLPGPSFPQDFPRIVFFFVFLVFPRFSCFFVFSDFGGSSQESLRIVFFFFFGFPIVFLFLMCF